MTTQADIKFDRSQLGVEYPAGKFHITREMILEYSRAIWETNPAFSDEEAARSTRYEGLVAPPSFIQTLQSDAGRPDIHLEFGDVGAHSGQTIETCGVIRPGDTLEGKAKLKDVYAKTGRSGTMVFAVWEVTFTNQQGKKVAAVQSSMVRMNRPQGDQNAS